MTMAEMQRRLETLEAEVRAIKSPPPKSWLDLAGAYGDDPTFDEATRLGREWREQVNRESLEEFDREQEVERQAAKKKRSKKPSKVRGTNGRA